MNLNTVNLRKLLNYFNPILDEGGKKVPPTSFFPRAYTNIGTSLKNFLIFSFNLFPTLVQNFKAIPSASLKLLNLNQEHSSEKLFFLVKPLWN